MQAKSQDVFRTLTSDLSSKREGFGSAAHVSTLAIQHADPFAKYYASGFRSVYKPHKRRDEAFMFADLLDILASEHKETRFRFTSPHPKDFPHPVLEVVAAHNNICKQLHVPAQSGSTSCLV